MVHAVAAECMYTMFAYASGPRLSQQGGSKGKNDRRMGPFRENRDGRCIEAIPLFRFPGVGVIAWASGLM
jgi:hypothetical protein